MELQHCLASLASILLKCATQSAFFLVERLLLMAEEVLLRVLVEDEGM